MTVDGIKCTGTDERFHHATVDNAFVRPPTEIEQVSVRSALIPCIDNRCNRSLSRTFHRSQAISYGFSVYRNKTMAGQIDVGWQDGKTIGNTVLKKRMHFIRIVHVGGKGSGHEFSGMMRLEVGGLEGDQGIGCRM